MSVCDKAAAKIEVKTKTADKVSLTSLIISLL